MKEFKLAKGWAIFVFIVTPVAMVFFTWFAISPFLEHKDLSKGLGWVSIPLGLGMVALMGYALREAIVGKFVIDDEKLYMVSAIGTRTLLFDEIKNYRMDDNYIYIFPKSKQKKTIKVSTYLKGTHEILAFLGERYDDTDLLERITDEEEIMQDTNFGATEEEREINLERTTNFTKIINWIGGAIALWTLFFTDPYQISILACIATPLIAIVLIHFSKGMIRLDEFNNSMHPNLTFAILAPSIVMVLRALFDYNVITYSNIWKPCIILTLVLLGLLFTGKNKFNFKKVNDYFTMFAFSLFTFGYAYGAIVCLNGMYDSSTPVDYEVRIIDKRVDTGKHTSYHFELAPWGSYSEKNEITVSRELYEKKAIQNTVQVHTKKGWFNIPWYFVSE